jgi:hypothetical protein
VEHLTILDYQTIIRSTKFSNENLTDAVLGLYGKFDVGYQIN